MTVGTQLFSGPAWPYDQDDTDDARSEIDKLLYQWPVGGGGSGGVRRRPSGVIPPDGDCRRSVEGAWEYAGGARSTVEHGQENRRGMGWIMVDHLVSGKKLGRGSRWLATAGVARKAWMRPA